MTFLKLELIPLFAGVPYDSSMQIDEYWHEYPMHYEMDYWKNYDKLKPCI